MQKELDKMIYELTVDGDLLVADISSTDYTVPAGAKIKGIIIGDGTVVSVDIKNSDGTTVSGVLIVGPGIEPLPNNVIKVNKSGSDSTKIWLVKKVPS